MGKFDGKVALVTGAGRLRGIGRYAALAFAKEGAAVAVTGTGRDPSTFPEDEREVGWQDVDSVAQEIRDDLGVGALPLVVDVSDPAQVQDAVDRTVREFGRVDFLVNNASASRMAAWAEFEDLTPEAWRHVMDVKVTGAFFCTQAVTKALLHQGGGGSIVNVISVEAEPSHWMISPLACSLVRVEDDMTIRMEIFPEMTIAEVQGFSGALLVYRR